MSLAFVVAPSAPSAGHLRATHAIGSDAPPRASTTNPFVAACAGVSIFAAVGAAATRRAGVQRGAAKKGGPKEDLYYGKDMGGIVPRPEDLLDSPKFPKYMGSTSGYFSKSTRERHAITWTSPGEYEFEMPTTGWALMNKGENLCYFRKKEQCIALGKLLRKMKIDDYKIYRIKKDGTVVFMHPADGVFPEKVNKGRVQVNGRPFSAGSNVQRGAIKWTKYNRLAYEADPLTTMFVKARLEAYEDKENIFPLPNLGDYYDEEDLEDEAKGQVFKSMGSL